MTRVFLVIALKINQMDNKEFGRRLEKRTRKFAYLIIKLSASLPKTAEGNVIRYQI